MLNKLAKFIVYEKLVQMGMSARCVQIMKENKLVAQCFQQIFQEGRSVTCSKKQLHLLFYLVSKPNYASKNQFSRIWQLIQQKKIVEQNQINKILDHLRMHKKQPNQQDMIWNQLQLEQSQVEAGIRKILDQAHIQQSYTNQQKNQLIKKAHNEYPFYSSEIIYSCVTKFFMQMTHSSNRTFKTNMIWDKLQSLRPRQIKEQENTFEIYQKYQKQCQGIKYFRFPPEPNGLLHLGHVKVSNYQKAIRINFQTALKCKGKCYLRFDDTNPQKQSQAFIQNTIQTIKWLGYQPFKITYASDYFQQILYYAIKLIKQGKAYACSQSKQQIYQQRKNKMTSPNRNMSSQQTLRIFNQMIQGNQQYMRYCIRIKLDNLNSNPTLRDPVIYRSKLNPHFRTKTKYRVYPSYDFTHPICDSIQNIAYSFCTLQFEIRRQLYFKILDLLGLYKPIVWQYSRLNVSHNILSKRKIAKLIEEGYVDGWDDPRLLTIQSIRNNGIPKEVILEFIDSINSSRNSNQKVVQLDQLQSIFGKWLNQHSIRTMGILNPLMIVIVDQLPEQLYVRKNPQKPQLGKSLITLCSNLFIEKEDFESIILENDLKQGIEFNLKFIGRVKIVKTFQNIQVIKVSDQSKKEKNLHWVSMEDAVPCNLGQQVIFIYMKGYFLIEILLQNSIRMK